MRVQGAGPSQPPSYSSPGASAPGGQATSRSVFGGSGQRSGAGGGTATATRPTNSLAGETSTSPLSTNEDSNAPAGAVAIFAGLLAILGSFMLWARDTGEEIPGFLLVRRVAAFDSNGPFTLLLGVGLVIVGILLVFGMRPLWLWSILAVVFGTLVLACVIWAYVDITGRASDDWSEYVAAATGTPDSTISTLGVGLRTSLGLWITAFGGLLAVLTAPLARRGD